MGRVLSLSCILFSMVVFGNMMTFEIIELDYVFLNQNRYCYVLNSSVTTFCNE